MKSIPHYKFHKTKYGEELLIDVVTLDGIRPYIGKHPTHTLSYFDITFITNGTGKFSIDNREYTLSEGDVIFSKPGEVRSWSEIPQGYALIFEEDFLLSFFNDPTFIRNLTYFGVNRGSSKINIASISARIDHSIQSIMEEINNKQSKDRHVLRALLYEILMLLNREYAKTDVATEGKPQNRHVDSFTQLVDNEFKAHHDTKYYADKLCLTPNYLNQIVQAHIGVSPKCYIQNKIIQEAKRLLSYTNQSVTEVAEELNFENQSYFIRLFRKQVNKTPMQYRQSENR